MRMKILTGFALAAGLLLNGAAAYAEGGHQDRCHVPAFGPDGAHRQRSLSGLRKWRREMFNERGGANGKNVTFAVADAPGPTQGNAEATRLVVRENVPLIAGTYASSIALAASEVNRTGRRPLLGDHCGCRQVH